MKVTEVIGLRGVSTCGTWTCGSVCQSLVTVANVPRQHSFSGIFQPRISWAQQQLQLRF